MKIVLSLQELGVHGCFTNIDEYCLNLIPFDYDLLSMEMESSFKVFKYLMVRYLKYCNVVALKNCTTICLVLISSVVKFYLDCIVSPFSVNKSNHWWLYFGSSILIVVML